jgi:DNA-binding NtrC family response regulator
MPISLPYADSALWSATLRGQLQMDIRRVIENSRFIDQLNQLLAIYPVSVQVTDSSGTVLFDEACTGEAAQHVRSIEVDGTIYGQISCSKDDAVLDLIRTMLINNLTLEVEAAELTHQLQVAHALLQEANRQVEAPLLGESAAVRALRARAVEFAATQDPLLISGRPGSGDEAVARNIHHLSERRDAPFIHINCAQYRVASADRMTLHTPEDGGGRVGVLEVAEGGTAYFEAAHMLPAPMQIELAEFLADADAQWDVRIILSSATHASSEMDSALVLEGSRRHQPRPRNEETRDVQLPIIFRLRSAVGQNVLHLPPLCDRADDIPMLADFFVQQYARKIGKPITRIAADSMANLCRHDWPGNIHELQSTLEQAVLLSTDKELKIKAASLDGGIQLDRYTLLEKLGEGGMGEVWRARHQHLARPVALKLVRVGLNDHPEERQLAWKRFEREAQTTARLQSPNTVKLFDYGVSDSGDFYFVMELLRGLDLAKMVKFFGAMDPERVVVLMMQACRSLIEAHELGLVHRDIKPENLFVCRLGAEYDVLKLLDFGIVQKDIGSESSIFLAQDDTIEGSPMFMAPELITGNDNADHRSDLYSLGCVAFWMLTRRYVFVGDTSIEILTQHVHVDAPAPSDQAARAIPPELDEIILACLAKNPADRPASAADLWQALSQVPLDRQWTQERACKWWDKYEPDAFKPTTVVAAKRGGQELERTEIIPIRTALCVTTEDVT